MAKAIDRLGNIREVETGRGTNGTKLYERGTFGQYSDRHGEESCNVRYLTGTNNMGYGSYWVARNATGNTFRLQLDGIQSDHTMRWDDKAGVYRLPYAITFEPVGFLMPVWDSENGRYVNATTGEPERRPAQPAQ